MFYHVSVLCVPKLSKVMLFLVVLVAVLCGTAIASDSSANSNVGLSSSQIGNLNSSNVANSSQQKSEVSLHQSSQSHPTNSSLDTPKEVPNQAGGDSQKPDCKTVPCQSSDAKQNVSKSLASNSSQEGQESTNPVEGSVNSSDPTGELNKKLNPEALMRGFYVFVGLSAIVMVYIAWKSFGKRPAQVHRYGVITNREDLEMAPLDSDEGDDDDTTHFDLSKHRLT